jgi:hypothetical protein
MSDFFEAYAKAADSIDLAFFESAYAETFMFAGPGGVQAAKREDFLRVLPKRKAFFASIGLAGTQVGRVEETALDGLHVMVRVQWALRFEKAPGPPLVDHSSATYILRRHEASARIVFQIDHQDLTKRAQELGLIPAHA